MHLQLDPKWFGTMALVIYAIVRLLKSDTKIPIDIPPRLRMPLAFTLAVLGCVLERVAGGATWQAAASDALGAFVTAVLTHLTVVDSARGGKELPVPGLTIPGVPPGPGKPPSLKPPPILPLSLLTLALAALLLTGCPKGASAPREVARGAVLTMADAVKRADEACAALAKDRADAKLATDCADGYDAARAGLLAAEAGIDAWEAGAQPGGLPCALSKAATGLSFMTKALTAAGAKVPTAVADALALARPILEACHA